MTTFICIYRNCYNSLRFFADLSKNCKKDAIFDNLRTMTQEREIQTNDPIFKICVSSPNYLGNSFWIWKLSKSIFTGSPFWPILVCKILEFRSWKLWDQIFLPLDSGNMHIEEIKRNRFFFSVELRINSRIFRVISWSIVVPTLFHLS